MIAIDPSFSGTAIATYDGKTPISFHEMSEKIGNKGFANVFTVAKKCQRKLAYSLHNLNIEFWDHVIMEVCPPMASFTQGLSILDTLYLDYLMVKSSDVRIVGASFIKSLIGRRCEKDEHKPLAQLLAQNVSIPISSVIDTDNKADAFFLMVYRLLIENRIVIESGPLQGKINVSRWKTL